MGNETDPGHDVGVRLLQAQNIVGERQAYGWWQYETDSYSYGRYAGKQLKPASFFQTCLGSNDTATYLSCLQNAYEACP